MENNGEIRRTAIPHELRAKLEWAEHHIDHVEAILTQWAEANLARVEARSSADGSHMSFFLVQPIPLPDPLPMAIGDALFNLRATLDNLIFSLHTDHTVGFAQDRSAQWASQWPIIIKPVGEKWSNGNKAKIKGLPDPYRAAIRSLQPHTSDPGELRHPDPDRVSGADQTPQQRDSSYERLMIASNIGLLDRLHGIDKHRRLHPVIPEAQFLVYDPHNLTYIVRTPFEFDDRQEIELSPPIPRGLFEPDLRVHPRLSLPVALTDSSGYYSVPHELRVFASVVRRVVGIFYDWG